MNRPARLVPKFLVDVLLGARNTETLHRLTYLAEDIDMNSSGSPEVR